MAHVSKNIGGAWGSAFKHSLLLLTVLAGVAKTEVIDPQSPSPTPPIIPDDLYRDALNRGISVYEVDPDRSFVLVHVKRGGIMKRLGHDHAIASTDIEGLIMMHDDPTNSRADLRLPLDTLTVDREDFRSMLDLSGTVSESAIAGTRKNMHEKVLHTSQFPWAQGTAILDSPLSDNPSLSISITLHGMTADYVVPVRMQIDDEAMIVSGTFSVDHRDFGLKPFTAVGGMLRVAKRLELRFELVTVPWTDP